jgi:hypothetical protein
LYSLGLAFACSSCVLSIHCSLSGFISSGQWE